MILQNLTGGWNVLWQLFCWWHGTHWLPSCPGDHWVNTDVCMATIHLRSPEQSCWSCCSAASCGSTARVHHDMLQEDKTPRSKSCEMPGDLGDVGTETANCHRKGDL